MLWSLLGILSLHGNSLKTAEFAYAAQDEVAKATFLLSTLKLERNEYRQAAIALFRRSYKEAENILSNVQSNIPNLMKLMAER